MDVGITELHEVLIEGLEGGVSTDLLVEQIHSAVLSHPEWWPTPTGAGVVVRSMEQDVHKMQSERPENPYWTHGDAALAVVAVVRDRIDAHPPPRRRPWLFRRRARQA